MVLAQRYALSTVLILLVIELANGQDYRYQTYGNNYRPPSQTAYDRNLPQSPNPYNPQLNQYGQQNNYPNRPAYNQPARPGTPSYRPNNFNNLVIIYNTYLYILNDTLSILNYRYCF